MHSFTSQSEEPAKLPGINIGVEGNRPAIQDSYTPATYSPQSSLIKV
jgi:hypothetical protein